MHTIANYIKGREGSVMSIIRKQGAKRKVHEVKKMADKSLGREKLSENFKENIKLSGKEEISVGRE